MSHINREGPSFRAWLIGRFTSPPATARCARCGGRGADPDVARELTAAGLKDAAVFANLCDGCRRDERNRRISGSLLGGG